MSQSELKVLLTAVDQFSTTLDNFKTKLEGVGTTAKEVEEKTKNYTISSRDTMMAFNNLGTAAFSLYNAYDRVTTSEVALDRANLIVKSSANALDDTHKRLTETLEKQKQASIDLAVAIKENGIESAQATKAQKEYDDVSKDVVSITADLAIAQERLQVATERADLAQGNLNQSMTSAVLSVIPTTITALGSLDTLCKSFADKSLLSLIKGIGGSSGLTEALGGAIGAAGETTGALGGLGSFIGSATFLLPLALGVAAIAGIAIAAINARNSLSDLELQMNSQNAAAVNVSNGIAALDAAYKNGTITLEQYNDLVEKLKESTMATYGVGEIGFTEGGIYTAHNQQSGGSNQQQIIINPTISDSTISSNIDEERLLRDMGYQVVQQLRVQGVIP